MARYCGKRTHVDAVRVEEIRREKMGSAVPHPASFGDFPPWVATACRNGWITVKDGYLWLDVGAGPQHLNKGDWVVCPMNGVIFGITDHALHSLYEPAE